MRFSTLLSFPLERFQNLHFSQLEYLQQRAEERDCLKLYIFLSFFFTSFPDLHDRCQHNCINSEGSFSCSCHDGYELKNDKVSCVDIDECVENNGNCSNICINLIGSHSCACEYGFVLGADNHTCVDFNECEDIHDCKQICINVEGTYECACRNGFILADKFNCLDINECLDSPCINGHCKNTNGSFVCECEKGFELSADGFTCQDVDECSHEVHRHSCSHHCHNTHGR